MAERPRVLSSAEVQTLVLDTLEAAADQEVPSEALVAARNVLAGLDRVSLLRVAGGLALFASRRQAGELTGQWLQRMRLEFAWRWS